MLRQYADQLQRHLEALDEWPPKREASILKDLYLWMAFREGDPDLLKPEDWRDGRKYVVDPLAARIAEAKADLVFGEEPDFSSHATGDQTLLEDLVEQNELPDELQQACEVQVSEGEAWWRILVDKDALDHPIIEWHSRTSVYPLYRGRKLFAAAFISVFEEDKRAWRYVEIHAEGVVLNRLYEVPMAQTNTDRKIGGGIPQATMPGKPFGDPVDLNSRPETEGIPSEWEHDLGVMLCGRVINKRGRNRRVGLSDYRRARDLLYSLNEACTIGHENLRLTAKKRMVTTSAALTASKVNDAGVNVPAFDPAEEAWLADQLDEELGRDNKDPFKILEYSFDADALISWDSHLEDKILIRCRTAPQLVGKNTEGAQTGPALRARLLDSILDANSRGTKWDKTAPEALMAAQLVDKLPTEQGGFGRAWTSADEAPTMERKSALPEDEDGQVLRLSTEVGSELLSKQTAIEERHPEWDEKRVLEEMMRIANEGGGPAPPPPDGEEEVVVEEEFEEVVE